MKELITGIVTLIGSLLTFTLVIIIGLLYALFHSIILPIQTKNYKDFFRVWWKLIDGTLATIGNMFKDIAISYDELGNVYGEWVEDSITMEDDTPLGDKNTTISASIGYLEHENKHMFNRGKKLSKILNIVFRQKKHALGSWLTKIAKEAIDAENYYESINKKK